MVAGDGVDESDEAMNLDPLNTDRIEIEERYYNHNFDKTSQ